MTTPQQVNAPDDIDLLKSLKKEIFAEMNCVNVGIIEAFDPATQTATIQIALKSIQDVEADGTRIIKERPLLLECPVMVLSGGASHLTMPIVKGDSCIVLFNDREIDNWFTSGGQQTPTSYRKHDIADGLAIVGIRNIQNAIDDYLVNGTRWRYNSTTQIDITDALIESTATLFKQNGNSQVTGDSQIDGSETVEIDLLVKGGMTILGNVSGNGGTITLDANLIQTAGKTISAANGATGTFTNSVTVVDGIVTGGT